MVVCNTEEGFCAFTLTFGILSIICFILVVLSNQDITIIIYNRNGHVLVLFLARFLCMTMIIEYFVTIDSKIFYFIKEYVLLITFCVTAYYFIFQAEFILEQYKLLRYLVYSSIFVSLLFFVIITLYFLFELALEDFGVPCNTFLWIMMRSLGLMMCILFIIMGTLIRKKINSIRGLLNEPELKTRMFYLW